MEKLLTVIVPCFQKEGILRLLKSIDGDHLEVIFVVDESKGNDLFFYLRELQKIWTNIQIVKKEFLGIADVRVYGSSFVTTPYFCFVDSNVSIRSKEFLFLVKQMNHYQSDMGIGRFQFHMGNLFISSRCKWNEGNHSFQEDLDLSRMLNIFSNKIFSSRMISILPNMSIATSNYEEILPSFFLGAHSSHTFITNHVLCDYYHPLQTSSLIYQSNPISHIDIECLIQLYLDGYRYGYESSLFPKHLSSYDSVFLRLFLQQIKSLFLSKKFDQDDKDLLGRDILEILSNLIPNWREHPNFQTGFKNCEFYDIYNSILASYYIKRKYYFEEEPRAISPIESYQQYCADLDNIRKKIL